tara:strand:- start:81 stop:515 length:435 start_codon:yes stop_codon:yes gene_type:complete
LKKSELKNIIKEALTPEEASKVAPKYKEFYSGMAKSNPLKLKKYDNPDAMVMGRVINHLTKNRKMEENRITELVKAALMGPISEKKAAADKKKMDEESTSKYDENPALTGKQSELPDGLQKAIIKKKGGKVDEIKERILRELRG